MLKDTEGCVDLAKKTPEDSEQLTRNVEYLLSWKTFKLFLTTAINEYGDDFQ